MKKYVAHFAERTRILFGRSSRVLRRRFLWTTWLVSWELRKREIRVGNSFALTSLGTISTFYINLDRRLDRKKLVEKSLTGAGISAFRRFSAVDGSSAGLSSLPGPHLGSIGCAMSHRNLLRYLRESNFPVMICEDDLEFVAGTSSIFQVMKDFMGDSRLDVLCLAANIGDKPIIVSENLSVSQDISTTACYVVKPRALPQIEEVFAKSSERLLRGEKLETASIDQSWKILQRGRLMFCVPNQRLAKQARSMSDITGALEDRGL